LTPDQLPSSLRDLPTSERAEKVAAAKKKREELASRIQQLNAERAKHLSELERQDATTGTQTLDSEAKRVVRDQMKARGFEVE
jgi:hypothetical protein